MSAPPPYGHPGGPPTPGNDSYYPNIGSIPAPSPHNMVGTNTPLILIENDFLHLSYFFSIYLVIFSPHPLIINYLPLFPWQQVNQCIPKVPLSVIRMVLEHLN